MFDPYYISVKLKRFLVFEVFLTSLPHCIVEYKSYRGIFQNRGCLEVSLLDIVDYYSEES